MVNMRHMGGVVTLRDFKTYLLLEGVRSQTDIQVLYEHFEIVIKTYRRTLKKKAEKAATVSGSDESSTIMAKQVYQHIKTLIDSETSTASSSKQLVKNGNLPHMLA